MTWLTGGIRWIMLVSGVLTSTMFYAAIAPRSALRSNFGEEIEGPLAEIIVRNWGALVGMVGLLLIYGAFTPAVRRVALSVAGASKVVFIGLILGLGRQYLATGAMVPVLVDSVMVLLFAWYLAGSRERTA